MLPLQKIRSNIVHVNEPLSNEESHSSIQKFEKQPVRQSFSLLMQLNSYRAVILHVLATHPEI